MRDSTGKPRAGRFRAGSVIVLMASVAVAASCRDKLIPPSAEQQVDADPAAGRSDAAVRSEGGTSIDPAGEPDARPADSTPAVRDAAAPDARRTADMTGRPPDSAPVPVDAPIPPPDTAPPPPPPPSCGAAGDACCPDNTCAAGACCGVTVGGERRCVPPGAACRLPGGAPAGTCTNGNCSACGAALNQLCCQGQTCTGAGLTCGDDDVCVSCGTADGDCCPGDVCNANLACVDDTCEPCGGPGQPCCANRVCNNGGCCLGTGTGECTAAGAVCFQPGPNGGQCMAGRCSQCGNAGQDCCSGNVCWAADRACVNDTCVACGTVNQPACPGRICDPELCVNDEGTCIAQGTLCGQASGRCMPGGSCMVDNTSCGGINLPCCGATSPPLGVFCTRPATVCLGIGAARRCLQCGDMNQPCCEGNICRAGTCGGFLGSRTCR